MEHSLSISNIDEPMFAQTGHQKVITASEHTYLFFIISESVPCYEISDNDRGDGSNPFNIGLKILLLKHLFLLMKLN